MVRARDDHRKLQAARQSSRSLRQPRLRIHAHHGHLADGLAGAGGRSLPVAPAHHAGRGQPVASACSSRCAASGRPHPARALLRRQAVVSGRERRPTADLRAPGPGHSRRRAASCGRPATRTCTTWNLSCVDAGKARPMTRQRLRRLAQRDHRGPGHSSSTARRSSSAWCSTKGIYPDGILTAPNDAALARDIELSLAAGFNGARLHQKVFEERFLYHADRLGYLVLGRIRRLGLAPQAARTGPAELSARLTSPNGWRRSSAIIRTPASSAGAVQRNVANRITGPHSGRWTT